VIVLQYGCTDSTLAEALAQINVTLTSEATDVTLTAHFLTSRQTGLAENEMVLHAGQ
jgi:hypothetical protein